MINNMQVRQSPINNFLIFDHPPTITTIVDLNIWFRVTYLYLLMLKQFETYVIDFSKE